MSAGVTGAGGRVARRLRGRRWWWAALLGVAVIAFGVGVVTRPGGSSALRVGHPTPAWAGTSLDGTKLTSGEERGKWVVLNFFATWCGPCKAETPQLVRFVDTNSSATVRVVGVVYADPQTSTVRSFAVGHDMTWPLLADAHDDISSSYGVTALPQSFVIRPDGTLAARIFGGVTAAGLDRLVGTQRGT